MSYKQSASIQYASIIVFLFAFTLFAQSQSKLQAQWGEFHTRNMVSDEVNLPESFSINGRKNIKWVASIGNYGYSTPVVAGDKVFIGANNAAMRDPKHVGDRGVLLCLDKSDGHLIWQLVVPRIEGDRHNDWPMIGISSPPTIDGDKVYILTNRSEVLCLDINGQLDGNDGYYQGENWFMSPTGEFSYDVGMTDADILWSFDMRQQLGMCPHDTPHSSFLIDGNNLYLNTCNGANYKHQQTSCMGAPSLIALDKRTGKLLAKDEEHFGPRIFHSSWASPSMGTVNGEKLLFFAGPDGIMYAFEALPDNPKPEVQIFKKVWYFDADPSAPKENIHGYMRNRNEGPSAFLGMPVFYKNRIYATVGGDIWWGKRKAWLKCIDAAQKGDITETGELWSRELDRHSASTPAISDGLIYVSDCGKNLHCMDAETGTSYWTHSLKNESWSSALVADKKVFVGSLGRDFWILKAGKEKQVLDSAFFKRPIYSTPVASDGVLYVATSDSLFAIAEE